MILGTAESESIAAAFAPLASPLASGGDDTGAASPLLPAVVSPVLILTLCIVAGLGTYFLLPGRRWNGGMRYLGAAILLLVVLVFALTLVRFAIGYAGAGVSVYFWIFSAIALFSALRVVTHSRPVYAALYFVLTVFATAGLFILLWAEFMAAALVLIYAGAILITYVFVIMLAASSARAGIDALAEHDAVSRDPVAAAAIGFALMGVMLFVIFDRAGPITVGDRTFTYAAIKAMPNGRTVDVAGEVQAPDADAARALVPAELILDADATPELSFSIQALGRYLFQEQPVNLELAGLILTLGMIGAILIARRRVFDVSTVAGTPAPETVVAPATPINDDPHSIPVYGTDNPRQKAYPET